MVGVDDRGDCEVSLLQKYTSSGKIATVKSLYDQFCRTQFGDSFCTCKPQKPDPREVWHNATLEQICKAVVPGYSPESPK